MKNTIDITEVINLKKVRTLKTLYLDHFDGEWSDDNPKMWSSNYWYKCGPEFDYEVMRKGSVLKVDWYDDEKTSILLHNKNNGMIVTRDSLCELYEDWFIDAEEK